MMFPTVKELNSGIVQNVYKRTKVGDIVAIGQCRSNEDIILPFLG